MSYRSFDPNQSDTSNFSKKQKVAHRGGEQSWRRNGPGTKFLIEKFEEFIRSNQREGINPKIRDRNEILKIFDQNPPLHRYIRNRFSPNFIALANNFEVNHQKEGTRKVGG